MSTNNSNEPTGWLPAFKYVPILSFNDCAEVIKLAEQAGLEQARYLQPDGSNILLPQFRRSHAGFFDPGHPVYEKIMASLLPKLTEINRDYEFELYKDSKLMVPNIHVLRYDGSEQGHLVMHSDTTGFLSNTERKLSISILLNPPCDYTGGRLRMFNGQVSDVQAAAGLGTGIVFPSFQYHEVTPVESGVRYVAVVFLKGPKFR